MPQQLLLRAALPRAGDSNTTIDNLSALLAFYKKFPDSRNQSLFIGGQGYAGGCWCSCVPWGMN